MMVLDRCQTLRDAGILAEERITIEPYPGEKTIPDEIDPTSILGEDGGGLDGSEIKGMIRIQSINIGREKQIYIFILLTMRNLELMVFTNCFALLNKRS